MSALVAEEPPPDSLLHFGSEPRFPLFRSHYCSASTWATKERMNQATETSTSFLSPSTNQRPTLRSLDLRSLQEDSTPTEAQLRRQKYLYFEKHCSEVAPGLFLSGDYVAKNRETLRQAGVTHVLNCVGFICKEYFKEELAYKTLFLQDTPAEDILCVLYDCLDYIDSALQAGGRILVHCSQGVSRSATLVIAYIMWRSGKPYDEVFAAVKAIRGVANPNIGFTCQLMQWQKRAATARNRMRLYRIAPHCPQAPLYLVPKLVTPPKQFPNNTHRDLDPRGAFVLQTPAGGPTFIWRGERCPEGYMVAAHRAAEQLGKFEGAGPAVEVRQGCEPPELLRLLDPAPLDPEAARINAKRSSITGEIELGCGSAHREPVSSGSGLSQLVPVSSSTDMEVDGPAAVAPSFTAGGGGPQGAGAAGPPPPAVISLPPLDSAPSLMELGTPRPRCAFPALATTTRGTSPASPADQTTGSQGGGGLIPPSCTAGSGGGVGVGALLEAGSPPASRGPPPLGGGGVSNVTEPAVRWLPQEVDDYTDDYDLYGHGQTTGKSSASGFEGAMRVSYDTAGGLAAAAIAAGPQGEMLFGPPSARPDSPATKEGRHKKVRRADSERPKHLNLNWTAACSDGIGPELARTHNVSSLHESVDEDVLGGVGPGGAGGGQAGDR